MTARIVITVRVAGLTAIAFLWWATGLIGSGPEAVAVAVLAALLTGCAMGVIVIDAGLARGHRREIRRLTRQGDHPAPIGHLADGRRCKGSGSVAGPYPVWRCTTCWCTVGTVVDGLVVRIADHDREAVTP